MIAFRTFHAAEPAQDLARMLQEAGIITAVQESSAVMNPYVVESIINKSYEVQIAPLDFERATAALGAYYASSLEHLPEDYYLLSFTDQELLQILKKPDEWGELDYELAARLLEERGIPVPEAARKAWRQARMDQLRQPRELGGGPSGAGWLLLAGYGLLIFGGFLGAMVGWHVMHSRTTLPDGSTFQTYSEAARRKGKLMYQIGLGLSAVTLIVILIGSLRGL